MNTMEMFESCVKNPAWLAYNDTPTEGQGNYSDAPVYQADGNKPQNVGFGFETGYISKHGFGGVLPARSRDRTSAINILNASFDRWDTKTLAGVAKHAGGGLTPHQMFFGGETMMTSARSDQWGFEIGMKHTPSSVIMSSIEHLSSGQYSEVWDKLAPMIHLDKSTPNVFTWKTQTYEPTMAAITSERGPGNTIEGSISSSQGRFQLYKISARLGVGFLDTEQGTLHAHHMLISMADSFILSGIYAASVALANADLEYQKKAFTAWSLLPTIDARGGYLARYWASFQGCQSNKLAELRADMQDALSDQKGLSPGDDPCWVVTKSAFDHLIARGERQFEYSVGGERALDLKARDKYAMWSRIDNDLFAVLKPVFFSHMGVAHPHGNRIDLSEHFTMLPADHPTWNIASLDRSIYDMDKEAFVRITLKHAIEHLCCWDEKGKFTEKENIAERVKELRINGVNTVDIDRYCFPYKSDSTKADKFPETKDKALELLDGAAKTASALPFGILAIQPHQRYFAENAYYMVPGKVLNRVDKPGDVIVSDTSPRFIHDVTAEKYIGTAVTNPERLVKVPNAIITGYYGGCGTKPLNISNGKYDPIHNKVEGDIIYIPVPKETLGSDIPMNINLLGDTTTLSGVFAPPRTPYANAYPGWVYVNEITNWRNMSMGDPTVRKDPRTNYSSPYPTSVISREMCYLKAGNNGEMSYLHEGSGFWGARATYGGVRRVNGSFAPNPPRGTYTID